MDKNKKNIISIIFIFAAFGAMVYILFFNGEEPSVTEDGILSVMIEPNTANVERFTNLQVLDLGFLKSNKFESLKEIELRNSEGIKGNELPFGEKKEE